MSNDPVSNTVIGALILAFVIYRQSVRRTVKSDESYLVNIILTIAGLAQTIPLLGTTAGSLLITTGISLIMGALFGLARGRATTLLQADGTIYRRGNWLTILLWLLGIGAHVGIGALTGDISRAATASQGAAFSSATALIYIALTLAAQKYIIYRRARKLQSSAV